jgi:hypothetical protein
MGTERKSLTVAAGSAEWQYLGREGMEILGAGVEISSVVLPICAMIPKSPTSDIEHTTK